MKFNIVELNWAPNFSLIRQYWAKNKSISCFHDFKPLFKVMEQSLISESSVCHSRFPRETVKFTKHFLCGKYVTNTFKL